MIISMLVIVAPHLGGTNDVAHLHMSMQCSQVPYC
jgi:hypothetical protein